MLQQAPHADTRHRVAWLAALLVAIAALCFLASAAPSQARAAVAPISTADPTPIEARVSITVTSLSKLNLEQGVFQAIFYLGITCSEPCQAADWDLVNANEYTSELTAVIGPTSWWRVSGTFVFQPDLRLFPFDTQTLPIIIEHEDLSLEKLIYIPDQQTSEVSSLIGVPGWLIEPFSLTTTEHFLVGFGETYSSVNFELPVGRSTVASLTKYYIPLLIFIILGAATLFLGRNDIQLRTAGTALVGLTIFYLFTSGGVGAVGYLTVWDISVLVAYISLGLVLLSGIIGAYLYHEHKFDGAEGEALNKRIRFGFLWGVILLVAVSAVAITLVAILT